MSLQKLKDAKKRELQAVRDGVAACIEAFPIGSAVTYEHGRHTCRAVVVGHCQYDARVRVRGVTGSEFLLDATRLYDFGVLLNEMRTESQK